MRECLDCGFLSGPSERYCPKCDAELRAQTDGSVWTVDIAHHHETVRQALAKLEQEIDRQLHEYTHAIRFVVGSGLIRDAARQRLQQLVSNGRIRGFDQDFNNAGAFVAELRRALR